MTKPDAYTLAAARSKAERLSMKFGVQHIVLRADERGFDIWAHEPAKEQGLVVTTYCYGTELKN